MPKSLKKSKYKSVVIKKKRYYFYKITWLDITGDSGHADLHSALGFMPSEMITHAYLLNILLKFAEYKSFAGLDLPSYLNFLLISLSLIFL